MEISSKTSTKGILQVEQILPPITDLNVLNLINRQVKRDVIRMIYNARSGHPAGALGCSEFLTSLFFAVMKHNPLNFDPNAFNQDIFILSNGHICAALYSTLARCGYFPIQELSTFRKINSRLQGHPATAENLPGIYIATGSLGQGLSVAIGAALAKKLNNDHTIVWTLISDGELQEGQTWEAIAFAAHHKVDNLITTVDWNNIQIDGKVEDVMSLGNLPEKIKASGWLVLELPNGNNIPDIIKTLHEAQKITKKNKPIMILMKTIPGKGIDFMEGDYKWHGTPPNESEFSKAIAQLPPTMVDF